MEACLANLADVAWMPVVVSTVVAFLVGWLWYSDKMFLKRWKEGIGEPVWQAPMWIPMVTQLFGTFLLAIIVHVAMVQGHIGAVVLIALVLMAFIKANGLYCGKSKAAIGVEVGYIAVMVVIMALVNV